VRSVRVEGRPVDFHQQPHEVGIDRRLKAGETVDVRVSYAGYPAQVSYQGEKTWNATKTEVVANGEPHMAPRWFPANDHPSDKARMRISITVPSRYDVIANGKQVSRVEHRGKNAGRSRDWATTTWRADEPMTSYLAYFAAGRYRTAEGTSRRGTPWLVAVSRDLPRRQQHASMNLMLRTPRMADWLATQLGDYPFATTGGLTHSLPLGFALENQTRPAYSAMGLENVYVEEVVVHELAHEWFGNSVALRRWSDIWLNEGIATFFEWRWFESGQSEKKAELTAAETLRDLYDNSRSIGRNFWKFQLSDPCVSRTQCAAKVFDRAVYLRGAMTTQALRNRIGERHFWELLRRWTAEHAGGHGTTHEFEALAEEVSGADLNGFFEAWLRTASKPASTRDNGLG
jgi:aminopeptidase N